MTFEVVYYGVISFLLFFRSTSFIYLVIYFLGCGYWVFVASLSLCLVIGAGSLLVSTLWLLIAVASLLCCGAQDWLPCGTCGIFLNEGSNPCPVHWQDSLPLDHEGRPIIQYF